MFIEIIYLNGMIVHYTCIEDSHFMLLLPMHVCHTGGFMWSTHVPYVHIYVVCH